MTVAKKRIGVLIVVKNNKLVEYIEIAKGTDRTMKEYADAAGVNLSTISRIKSGDYTPGIKILRKLTSDKAQPRGGVNFTMLFEALMLSNPLYSMVPVVGPVIAESMATISETKNMRETELDKKGNEVALQKDEELQDKNIPWGEYNKERRRFSATATGIICNAIVQKGIHFQTLNVQKQEGLWYSDEQILKLEGAKVEKWFLIFESFSKENRSFDKYAKDMALRRIGQLVLNPAAEKQKVSMVVNDLKLYHYLLDYKDKLSYKGNLSIIFVDSDEVIIRKEEYLSYYNENHIGNLVEVV